MSNDYNVEASLEEYGYSKKKGGGFTIAIIVLLILLVIGAGGIAFFTTKKWSEEQGKTLANAQQLKDLSKRVSELETENADLSSRLADMQSTNERIKKEWTTQVATLKEQHKEQLQRTYGQMNEILYDSRATLAYIGDIEGRLRNNQNLATEEAAALTNIAHGVTFLYEQYKKPMAEFRELDRYFAQQLASIPETSKVNPKETTPVLKRIFKNRQFKEQQATYNRDQGKIEVLKNAQAEVKAAYARAQAEMKKLDLRKTEYLRQLYDIVDSNQVAAEEVQAFFDQSKEILKIHDRIMKIEAPTVPTVRP